MPTDLTAGRLRPKNLVEFLEQSGGSTCTTCRLYVQVVGQQDELQVRSVHICAFDVTCVGGNHPTVLLAT